MSLGLIVALQLVNVPASGISRAVPPTKWSCDLTAADGSGFKVAGITPLFPAGANPNAGKPILLEGSGALVGKASVTPGEASDYFRDFQVSTYGPRGELFNLNLKLRRNGTSVAYTTRYLSTGERVPYDYHAAGLCTADFGHSPATESAHP